MNSNFTEVCIKGILNLKNVITMGAFFCDYSGYYYYYYYIIIIIIIIIIPV